MVLSAAAKAARAAVAAAIKRKKANITTKRKKYPGLEKKFRDDNLKKNLQKARNQRHGQTHRQLTGPRPVTSGGQTGVGRSPKLTRFTESYAKNKVAWGVIDEFGNKKIRGIGPKTPTSYNQFNKKSDDIFDFFKSKGWG